MKPSIVFYVFRLLPLGVYYSHTSILHAQTNNLHVLLYYFH